MCCFSDTVTPAGKVTAVSLRTPLLLLLWPDLGVLVILTRPKPLGLGVTGSKVLKKLGSRTILTLPEATASRIVKLWQEVHIR